MPIPAAPLPPNVLIALEQGNAVEAIKLLRQSTGLGLKEAKDVIDDHLRGHPPAINAAASAGVFPPSVVDALHRGNKIEAIKLLRQHSGLGLKEAKDAIDAYQQETDARGGSLSPGQVRGPGSAITWLVVLIIAAVAAYYFLRGPG